MEILQEVLDHSIEQNEHEEMKHRLDNIIQNTKNHNYKRLAMELEDFVDSDALTPVDEESNLFDKIITTWSKLEESYLTETRFRVILIGAFALLGLPNFMRFIGFATVAFNPVQRMAFLENIASGFPISSSNMIVWAMMLVVFDGLAGAFLSISSILLLVERRNWSTQLASVSLILSLVAINLVLFYVEQFQTIINAITQYATLQAVYYYQRKYVKSG